MLKDAGVRTNLSTDLFSNNKKTKKHFVQVTSSLSARRSFWLEEEPAVTDTGGLPGTMTGVLGRMSVGTRPMLWDIGVR